jgi:large subunit ribosomal protein L10
METKKAHVSKEKVEGVKKLAEQLKKHKTIMILSIKSLPSQQFQKMKKELRGKAYISVAKKSTVIRAIEQAKLEGVEELLSQIKEDCAIAVSNSNAFELAAWFTENQSPVSAKEGQEVEDDITISEGPTELVPGPVISELGALGLQIMVEDGKITIRKAKVVLKKGDKVNGSAASILMKLGVKPFMVGITPLAVYDADEKKVYVGIKVDKKKVMNDVLVSYSKALGFARGMNYVCRETIGQLLGKANNQANALNKLKPAEIAVETQN